MAKKKTPTKRSSTKAVAKKPARKQSTARRKTAAAAKSITRRAKPGGARATRRGALAAAAAIDIVAICEANWDANKSDCSAFVSAVADAVGIDLDGNADAITDTIQGSSWSALADGAAAAAAAASNLVVAGLKGSDQDPPTTHGHVVVVVPGDLAQDKYPHAYWGKLGGIGKKNETINWAWKKDDRDRVHYGAKPFP